MKKYPLNICQIVESIIMKATIYLPMASFAVRKHTVVGGM